MNLLNLLKKNLVSETASTASHKQTTPTSKFERVPGKKHVFNLIILDESGSMQSIFRPALTGVNETLQTIRSAQAEMNNQVHFVSLMTFDTRGFKMLYDKTPAEQTTDITPDQYCPCAGTPLYDAMGSAITNLRKIVENDDMILVTVITDGYENASHNYNSQTIKALVEELKQDGWVFTYIGANQDVEAVGDALAIDNRLAFDATDEGTEAMFVTEKSMRKRFYDKINLNVSREDLANDYFV